MRRMHLKPSHYVVFLVVASVLVFFAQKFRKGDDTSTFVAVIGGVLAVVLLTVLWKAGSRRWRRTFGKNREAAADFWFGPTAPGAHLPYLQHMQHRAEHHAAHSPWNAPALPRQADSLARPQVAPAGRPMLPDIQQALAAQTPPTTRLPASRLGDRPTYGAGDTRFLDLGQGFRMPLSQSLTGALLVDSSRRSVLPVFLEEWGKQQVGLLLIDVDNQYAGMLDLFPRGFLAGSRDAQDQVPSEHQGRYMPLVYETEARRVGEGIIEEGLQVIFNVASYHDTALVGVLLLRLLDGIAARAIELKARPTVIALTNTRPLMPADEADCLVTDEVTAQAVYDRLVGMVEHAGRPGYPKLGCYLAAPSLSLEGIEPETLETVQRWIVHTPQERAARAVSSVLDLQEDEIAELLDGKIVLLDAASNEVLFLQFRASDFVPQAAAIASLTRRPGVGGGRRQGEGKTDALGELLGLKEKEQA